jgi:hypothetical protein
MLEGKSNVTDWGKARYSSHAFRIGYKEENMGDRATGIYARHPFHRQCVSGE